MKTPAGKTREDAGRPRASTGREATWRSAGPEALRRTHAAVFECRRASMLEAAGKAGRVHGHGFVRLAWRDEVDGTPQYCRAYLPAGYGKS